MDNRSVFEVGKPYLPALGLGEGVRFGIDGSGCFLMYEFNRPTDAEVSATKSGQPFEIKFVTVNGIIWILSKCGTLRWTDAPYNPRLSSSLPDPASIGDKEGLAMTLVMLDSYDAVVKSTRLIGLGTDFSRHLASEVLRVRSQPMTVREAGMSISQTMRMYSTELLVQKASNGFKL
jgi:hypothetical protein